ncbi:hypothetical protein ACFV2D_04960 [Streptomyces capillispiralis]|uniref:hypothetical protein n=1 Tax=Streptomyces capillispiralis TaxID=68182 RepID=UPI003699FA1A
MALSKAARAERDARIYALAVAGRTERQIAAAENLSPSRVHGIIAEEIGRRVGPPAAEYADRRDAELQMLWSRAFALLIDKGHGPDVQLKAMSTALRVNESRRKLRGADAPESLSLRLERRSDEETEAVTAAVLAALRVLRVEGERRTAALEAAAAALTGGPEPEPLPPAGAACTPYVADGALFIDGPGGIRYRVVAEERSPAPVVSRLALPPGPSARRYKRQQPDSVDAVLEAVAEFEEEFGPLDDDADGDGTGGTGADDPEDDGTGGTGTGGA